MGSFQGFELAAVERKQVRSRFLTAFSSFPRKNKREHSEFLEVKLRPQSFRDAWRGSGSSGFFDLSRLFGSTNE